MHACEKDKSIEMEPDPILPLQPEEEPMDQDRPEAAKDDSYFPPIGIKKQPKVVKVRPILPAWITTEADITYFGDNETDAGDDDLCQLESLIDSRLMENIRQSGIVKLFPVQRRIMPRLIEDLRQRKYRPERLRDVAVLSPTGSGKTLAYAVPIVNHLLNRVVTQIRALIILPVGELALQVYRLFQSLCKNTTLRIGLATGTNNSGGEQPIYRNNDAITANHREPLCLVDILVATPGRLLDLIHQNGDHREQPFHLKHLEMLVIDEADRMMNETQSQWLKAIEHSVYGTATKFHCPCLAKSYSPPQSRFNFDSLCGCSVFNRPNDSLFKMLFSATFTTDPEKIDAMSLYRPVLFNVVSGSASATATSDNTVEPQHTIPENLKELMIITDADKKPLMLWHLIKDRGHRRVLCFTNSVLNAQRLYGLMKYIPELTVSDFHSQHQQRRRKDLNKLKKFEQGEIDLLISTDITARGMDIPGVDCVVCYDVPRNETAYIHRIGRTARAGRPGTAVTIISRDELKHFNIVLRRAHKNFGKQVERLVVKNSDLRHLIPAYRETLERLKTEVAEEKQQELLRKKRKLNRARFRF